MPQNDSNDIRSAAELLLNNTRAMSLRGSMMGQVPPSYDITRAHSINLITEEFLGGYTQDGRMSVVRRFFCLFVTFDLFFVSLLWLICIMLNGDNIFEAFQKQIVHYSVYTSLFDVVAIAIGRFMVLLFFYAFLYINHWFIIALSTTGSCFFLISKVFLFDWVDSKQQAFEVILVIASFVLAWGEAWFLDCRVFPQERHASRYFSSMSTSDRSPLMAPFLATHNERQQPESAANFYSPLDSAHNSDDEEDDEYHQIGLDCVRKVYELLEASDWKVEKITNKQDTIQSIQREKLGKIYRLTGRLKYPPKALTEELFHKVEFVPKWNPTLLESKIVHKINSYTDITYQASVGGGGGIIKSRDFVNLRCMRLLRDGNIVCGPEEDEISSDDDCILNRSCEGSVSTLSGDSTITTLPGSVSSSTMMKLSTSSITTDDIGTNINNDENAAFESLSRSLGAKGFAAAPAHIDFEEPPPLDEQFEDAKDNLDVENEIAKEKQNFSAANLKTTTINKVWVTAAVSVNYDKVPKSSKYIRGENLVTGFALRPIEGKADACIFEWILCLDLKGYIPRRMLDTAYTTFMSDYMMYLRKYVKELRERRRPRQLRN